MKLEWDMREAARYLQAKVAILQDLFPSGIAVVSDVLAREVDNLAGNRSDTNVENGFALFFTKYRLQFVCFSNNC